MSAWAESRELGAVCSGAVSDAALCALAEQSFVNRGWVDVRAGLELFVRFEGHHVMAPLGDSGAGCIVRVRFSRVLSLESRL